MKLLNIIRGIFLTFCYLTNLLIFSILTGLVGLIVWLIPWKPWHHYGTIFLLKFPTWWMTINRVLMTVTNPKKWKVEGSAALDPKKWYVLVCNHQSWFDILVLGSFFNYKTPILKFFMKKELLWTLPVAGVVCYFVGYPFMRRHTPSEIKAHPELKGKDIETTKKACEKFKEFPTTIMIFVEGTRFSETKRLNSNSPYQHLLKPKGGGAAIVINEMPEQLAGVLNVTIDYSTENLSLWKFVRGKFKQIYLHYELLPITEDLLGEFYEDREHRKRFTSWLNNLWKEKDLRIEAQRNAAKNTELSNSPQSNGSVAS